MSVYCVKAKELIEELKRSDWIPRYNDEAVRQTIEEIRSLYNDVTQSIQVAGAELSDPAIACGMVVHHESAYRNKRCLLAYLNERMHRIERLRWEAGATLNAEVRSKLSPHEEEFAKQYDSLLTDYIRDTDIDITMGIEPPKYHKLTIRALEDCGIIETESGAINLKKGMETWVPQADVEHLIRQGMVEVVERERA